MESVELSGCEQAALPRIDRACFCSLSRIGGAPQGPRVMAMGIRPGIATLASGGPNHAGSRSANGARLTLTQANRPGALR